MTKQELLVDFITSLDGYGAAEGWPGWWGLEGPEYLAWLGQQPERDYTILMGANTYRLMSGFASQSGTSESDLRSDEEASVTELANASKVVFSATLQPPLPLPILNIH
jgi:dihydrofolate reductase